MAHKFYGKNLIKVGPSLAVSFNKKRMEKLGYKAGDIVDIIIGKIDFGDGTMTDHELQLLSILSRKFSRIKDKGDTNGTE